MAKKMNKYSTKTNQINLCAECGHKEFDHHAIMGFCEKCLCDQFQPKFPKKEK